MALNFNVDPYYDDFDPSKNFHRILFKPGYAVQARELTQSQTILQNQISNFADAIFSQNTPVSGGRVSLNFAAIGNIGAYYVKLQTQFSGVEIDVNNFLNKDIQDVNGIVQARVIAVAEGTLIDPPTLVVTYYTGAKFKDASTIICTDGSNFSATTIGTNTSAETCTGASSTVSISEGIFYIINGYNTSNVQNPDGTYNRYSIGNFVSVLPQTIILDKYASNPSGRVGLSITETIVDYIDDTSLLDPAVGASNYQAPGADRYKISLELVVLPLTPGNDDQFIELVRLENGKILKQVDGTVYSVINDYISKRTYETDGDFIVNEFSFTPTANTVNPDLYDLKISKGLAYIRGYRVENQSDITFSTPRARSNNIINNNQVYVDYGSYVLANNVSGTFDITTMPKIDLHCVANSNIVSTNSVTYSATLIGSAFLRNIDYESSVSDSDTSSYSYKMYITDVSANTLSGTALAAGSSPTTIQFNDTNGKFSAVANAYFGVKISALTSGYTDVREIVSYDGTTKTATVDSPFTLNPTNSTQFNLLFSTTDIESLINVPNGPATPTVRTASANIPNAGKFNGLFTGDTILYNPTQAELLFTVGYPYVSNISDSSYISQKVFRSKSFTSSGGNFVMTLSLPVNTANIKFIGTGTLSSDAIKQNFTVVNKANNRQILDFVSAGNTVVISSDQKTATFTTPVYGTTTVDVIAGVSVGNADNSTLVLKAKNLVVGNTQIVSYAGPTAIVDANTYLDLTNGQIYIKESAVGKTTSLYVSDVKKIRKIISTKSSVTVPTTSMLSDSSYDVTSLFLLDNGQRDNYYDFSAVRLKPGASRPLGNLLVIFDYYAHTGGDGYFDVNSYLTPISSSPDQYREIGQYTSKAGINYRLTDSLDFRPVRQAPSGSVSSVPFTLEYTGNPSAPDDSGILIPQNLSYFTHDYAYYLGRKDKLVITKDNTIDIILGTPSVNPTFPAEPDGALLLAKMTLDPYTGYIPGEDSTTQQTNYSIERVQHKNWIKRDITDLQDRVNNLEYYTALSLLEQNAQSLQIPDSNGLNRFKNGILVDDFSSYATADTRLSEGFNAKIDIAKKQLTPRSIVDNLALKNPIVLNSLGTIKQTNSFYVHTIAGSTNIYTLPYTTKFITGQTLASSVVSVNPFGVIRNEGSMQLCPPMDNWVDNQQAPDILVVDPRLQLFQASGTNLIQNAGNWQTIPGTTSQTLAGTSTAVTTTGNIQTTTTTQTFNVFGNQIQNVINSGYSAINSTIGLNNGYITNIGILGYIRPQRVRFRASGLLANAKLKAFFDGVDVSNDIVSPNIIRVDNVSGVFREDDIVGFEIANVFYPVGRVLGVTQVPGASTSYNLAIFDIDGAPEYLAAATLRNARFDENGVYVSGSTTASGQLSSGVSPLNVSGTIRGPAGSLITNANTNANLIFRSTKTDATWGDFLKINGMWATGNNITAYRSWDATYTFTANTGGNYVIAASSWRDTTAPFVNRTATITIDGTVQISATELYNATPTGTVSKTISLTPGNHTIRITANGSGTPLATVATQSGLACIITEPVGTPGRNIVFNALYPPSVDYPSGTQIILPLGGAYFDGFTRVSLAAGASQQDDFYIGSTITITTKYLYTYLSDGSTLQIPVPFTSGGAGDGGITVGSRTYVGPDGRTGYVLQSIETYTANIIDYDGQLRIATLDTPVNLSLGDNQLFGNINSTYSIKGNLVSLEEAIIDGTTVPTFSSDAQGNVTGLFEIRPNRFRTGERLFRLDNRTISNDPLTATCYAEATFTASGLSSSRQKLEFAPSVDAGGKTFIQTNQRSGAFIGTATQTTVTQQVIAEQGFRGCCFIAGTKITMADGSIKNIEDVQIGDELIGKDGSVNTVLEYVRPVLGERTLISLNDSTPFITNDHPVYMKDGTWKSFDPVATKLKYKKLSDWNIGKLEVGDVIETVDGVGFKIETMSEHSDRDDLQVYNFSLNGNHTYIANNLVVHNKCFVAGTEVLMKDNTWKNIEDVELNDVLIGESGSENRVREFHRPTLGLMDHILPHKLRLASINNSDFSVSEDHMIKTTSGWRTPTVEMCKILHAKTLEIENIDITQLQLGDDIICSDGSLLRVESIEFKEDAPEIQLYNFRLFGNKTYHVRMKGSDKFILVHNKCFTSGTEVLMKDNTWKNIEDVEINDVLIGENGSENRVREFHRPTLGLNDHILPHKLRLASINESNFSVSEDHMIKTTSGWRTPTVEMCKILHAKTLKGDNIDISQLQIGDEIICSDGSLLKVETIEFKEDVPELQLYNFKLYGNKTYHVRMKGAEKFMLVHNKCFTSGTEVLMHDGSWKNIEEVELGDILLGEDGAENMVKEFHRPVLGLNDHILPHNLRLASINNSEFSVSEDHMIKTTSGWRTPTVEMCKILHAETLKNENIDITQLQLGDEIICSDGSLLTVDSIEFKEDAPDLQLYNFKLHGNKTYHVRLKGSDKFILVHNKDPLAQTFAVPKDNYPNGAFLRSVKLFFQSKPTGPNAPDVEVYVVGTTNGYPNGKNLDYSVARVKAQDIKISNNPHWLDPETATEFVFPAPVYIQNSIFYAFVVFSHSPDYTVYFGQQNAVAVPSTTKALPTDPNPANPGKIGATPYVGGLFESQNAVTWQVDQTKQMMFVIDQCVFTTSDSKTLEFSLPSGLPFRAIDVLNDIVHTTSPASINNTYGNFAQKVPVMRSDAVNVTTTDFIPTGAVIKYTASATLNDGANTVVGQFPVFPGRLGSPTYDDVDYDDGRGPRALLRDANNSFRLFATMATADSNTSPIIADDGVSLYNIRYVINNLELSNSMIEIVDGGTGYHPANVVATVSPPDIGSDAATCGVVLTSNVITNVYLTTFGSGYVKTPTITITGANTTPATVLVRGETSSGGGNLTTARYLTKVVKLTPDNESGDLRVFYTAYKPLGTEIYVYYKILNSDDTDVIDDKEWQLMTQTSTISYSLSKQNLIEYECAPGVNNLADNFISYTKGTETYNSFNQFQIKFVMTTEDTTNIPFVTDIRALALPSGTGL